MMTVLADCPAASAGTTKLHERGRAVEHRMHPRWIADQPYPVLVRLGDHVHACDLRDISAGGASLARNFHAEIGFVVVVEVNDVVRLPGVVVRLDFDAIAVTFVLSELLAEVIDKVIRHGLGPTDW